MTIVTVASLNDKEYAVTTECCDNDGFTLSVKTQQAIAAGDIWGLVTTTAPDVLCLPSKLFFIVRTGVKSYKKTGNCFALFRKVAVDARDSFSEMVSYLWSGGIPVRLSPASNGAPSALWSCGGWEGREKTRTASQPSSVLGNFNFCYKKKGC